MNISLPKEYVQNSFSKKKKKEYERNSLDSSYTKRKGIKSVNTFAWSPTIYHIHFTQEL